MKMKDRLLGCISCSEAISLTPCDFSPGDQQQTQIGIFSITEEERGKFEECHQGHQLERLEVKRDSYVSEHPWSQSIREGFFEAIDNQKGSFVVKQWREKADEPMKYELVGRGRIRIENEEIEVQEVAIKKQLKAEAQKRNLSIAEWEIDGFIGFLEAHSSFLLCKRIPEKQMVFNDNPLVAWVKLDESLIDQILSLSENIFGPRNSRKYQFIRDFVGHHNQFNDVLALKIKRKFEIVAFESTNRLFESANRLKG